MKTALIFGVTGLAGGELLRKMVDDAHYSKIEIFSRKNIRIQNLHVEVHQVDFEDIESFAHLIAGDDCYCCMGSTMKTAGSRSAFYNIDFNLVLKIAGIAAANQVKKFAVISSLGADAASKNFYLRTKGEMEKAILKLPFEQVIILRPSILAGKRKEFRPAEQIGKYAAQLISPLMLGPLKKYQPIQAKRLAIAMLRIMSSKSNQVIYESDEIMTIGKN